MVTAADPPASGTVVVGVDESAPARAALRWAVAHARRNGSRVRAVMVWTPTPRIIPGPDPAAANIVMEPLPEEQLGAEAQERLDAALAALHPRDAELVDRVTVPGDAATTLVDAARDAELLVLGNAGRGPLAAAVTGSVAARCLHHARCPVVLVPGPDR